VNDIGEGFERDVEEFVHLLVSLFSGQKSVDGLQVFPNQSMEDGLSQSLLLGRVEATGTCEMSVEAIIHPTLELAHIVVILSIN